MAASTCRSSSARSRSARTEVSDELPDGLALRSHGRPRLASRSTWRESPAAGASFLAPILGGSAGVRTWAMAVSAVSAASSAVAGANGLEQGDHPQRRSGSANCGQESGQQLAQIATQLRVFLACSQPSRVHAELAPQTADDHRRGHARPAFSGSPPRTWLGCRPESSRRYWAIEPWSSVRSEARAPQLVRELVREPNAITSGFELDHRGGHVRTSNARNSGRWYAPVDSQPSRARWLTARNGLDRLLDLGEPVRGVVGYAQVAADGIATDDRRNVRRACGSPRRHRRTGRETGSWVLLPG